MNRGYQQTLYQCCPARLSGVLVSCATLLFIGGCDEAEDLAHEGQLLGEAETQHTKTARLNTAMLEDEILEAIDSSRAQVSVCAEELRDDPSVQWSEPRISLNAKVTLRAVGGKGQVSKIEIDWPDVKRDSIRECLERAFLTSSFSTSKRDFEGLIDHSFCIGAPLIDVGSKMADKP